MKQCITDTSTTSLSPPHPWKKKKIPWLKYMKNLQAFTKETETSILEEGVEKLQRNILKWETFWKVTGSPSYKQDQSNHIFLVKKELSTQNRATRYYFSGAYSEAQESGVGFLGNVSLEGFSFYFFCLFPLMKFCNFP